MDEQVIDELRAKGLPEHLRALLEAPTKRDAERLARDMVITGEELVRLIVNCEKLGYRHSPRTVKFVPKHLERTEAETNAFFAPKDPGPLEGDARKFFRKVVATFNERRVINVHMFEKDA